MTSIIPLANANKKRRSQKLAVDQVIDDLYGLGGSSFSTELPNLSSPSGGVRESLFRGIDRIPPRPKDELGREEVYASSFATRLSGSHSFKFEGCDLRTI